MQDNVKTFEEFSKELPDIESPFAGEIGMYKAKYDTYSGTTRYFKNGRKNSDSISLADAYSAYLYDKYNISFKDLSTEEKKHLFGKHANRYKFAGGGEINEKSPKVKDPEIAKEIIRILGGTGRLHAMTGAYGFLDLGNGVSFRIKNQKTNCVKIVLTSMDWFDVEIGRLRGGKYTIVNEYNGVYNDMLKRIIEKGTGMYLSLADGGKLESKDKPDHLLTEDEYINKYKTEKTPYNKGAYDEELAKEDYKVIIESATVDGKMVFDGKYYWFEEPWEGMWHRLGDDGDTNAEWVGDVYEGVSDDKPDGESLSIYEYEVRKGNASQEEVDKLIMDAGAMEIEVDDNDKIVNGHHRAAAALELGIPIKTKKKMEDGGMIEITKGDYKIKYKFDGKEQRIIVNTDAKDYLVDETSFLIDKDFEKEGGNYVLFYDSLDKHEFNEVERLLTEKKESASEEPHHIGYEIKMEDGGNVQLKARKKKEINKANKELVDFDLSNLNPYEDMVYYDLVDRSKLSKENALQIIINQVEGDYSQLSDELAAIAEKQDDAYDVIDMHDDGDDEFADGGEVQYANEPWVVYDSEKHKLISNHKNFAAAKRAMNKLWKESKFDNIGIKTKKKWDAGEKFADGGNIKGNHNDVVAFLIDNNIDEKWGTGENAVSTEVALRQEKFILKEFGITHDQFSAAMKEARERADGKLDNANIQLKRRNKKISDGGETNGVKVIDYKDQTIIYIPDGKKNGFGDYSVDEEPFDTLEDAKVFIDNGGSISAETKRAYSKGLFSDGGTVDDMGRMSKGLIISSFKKHRMSISAKDISFGEKEIAVNYPKEPDNIEEVFKDIASDMLTSDYRFTNNQVFFFYKGGGGKFENGGKVSEKEMRDTYIKAFGKEFDSEGRKQSPLPIEIAYKTALHKLSSQGKDVKSIKNDQSVNEDKFASGGNIKYVSEADKYNRYWGRKGTRGESQVKCVGSFDIKENKRTDDFYLYELDDFDKDFYKHVKLKAGERLFRYESDATKIGKYFPLVKLNVDRGLVYFLKNMYSDDDKNPVFETRGIKPIYISFHESVKGTGAKYSSNRFFKDWSDMIKNI